MSETNIPSATTAPSAKQGLSGGAVAGVAIGCLVAGAIVAGGIVYLLLRRRNQRQSPAHNQHQVPRNGGLADKAPASRYVATADNVTSHLPQPVEDDAMTKELSRLRDNIKNHVRTYYRLDAIAASNLHESQLEGLAADTGVNTSALLNGLLSPSKRSETIRLFVAWVILSKCEGNRYPTLLPSELAPLVVSMPGKDGSAGDQSALYSKWKTITGALLRQRYGKQTQVTQEYTATISELDSVLSHLTQGLDGERRRNLEMIITRAANFAFLLFSQPGSFHFDFHADQGGMPVFPGFQQVIDDRAQVLTPPRALSEKEYAEIGL